MPRGGKRPGAGRPRKTDDPLTRLLADPQMQLTILIMSIPLDNSTRMELARKIDRYARDRRPKKSKFFESVAESVDAQINPKPLLITGEQLRTDGWDGLLDGTWNGLEFQK